MTKHPRRKNYSRLRADTGQHRRILAVMAFLCAVLWIPVGFRLYQLMIREYDYYAGLALRNQTRTTAVAADRGTIYDRNMNILAISQGVENVYLNPHELKQSKADVDEIAEILGLSRSRVSSLKRMALQPISLQAPVTSSNNDKETRLEESLQDHHDGDNPVKSLARKLLEQKLHTLLDSLPERTSSQTAFLPSKIFSSLLLYSSKRGLFLGFLSLINPPLKIK